MNINTFLERREREQEQGTKQLIVDRHYIEKQSAEKFAREAKSAKIAAWISAWAAIVAAIVAIITLFKS
ncbi:MAG TPA: hypothetical protein VFS25_06500 [Chitinophaga sp.]|uniref:hypothetical protein n=1 Tax=Chitinophaga sp. TaxID=1869181 RepID=UPI002DBE5038|nr:hypothetical protein [Chitinophaga sp.]HEU4552462.1 hypothetical protein [Chitinophaga sp.]